VPESLALEDQEALTEVHRAAIAAGADLVLTNTFAATGPALEPLGLRESLREILRRSVQAAGRAIEDAGRRRDGTPLLGVVLGPLPEGLEPRGPMRFEAAVEAYREAAGAVADLAPDLFVLESFGDLRNLKTALIALRETAPEVPVAVQMVFGANGRTAAGASPAVVWAVARSLGAEVVGASGGLAPEGMLPVLAAFHALSDLPVMLQPSALAPGDEEALATNDFLRACRPLIEKGPSIVGVSGPHGPEWLQGLTRLCKKHEPRVPDRTQRLVVTGSSRDVEVGPRRGIVAVGEWPATRGEAIRASRDRGFGDVIDAFHESARAGAQMLEVRSTLPQIEEPAFLTEMLPMLEDELRLPVMVSAETRRGLEAALQACAGRPLVSAVWDEPGALERVLPLAARHGAAVVAVCHTGGAIPTPAEERVAIAERLLQAALTAGLRQEDVILDPVAFHARDAGDKLRETLRALALIKEKLGQPTLLRLSGVSDELPVRSGVEAAFLAMAAAAGLDMAVLNGSNPRLIDAALTASMLAGRDREARRFLARFGAEAVPAAAGVGAEPRMASGEEAGEERPRWRPVTRHPRPRGSERDDRRDRGARPGRHERGERPERRDRGDRSERPDRPRREPWDRERSEGFRRPARARFDRAEREGGDRQPFDRGDRRPFERGNREGGDRRPYERDGRERWQPPERRGFRRGARPAPGRAHFDREDLSPSERWGMNHDDHDRPARPRFDREGRGSRPPGRGSDRERQGPRPPRPGFDRERPRYDDERRPRRREPMGPPEEQGGFAPRPERHGRHKGPRRAEGRPGRPPRRREGREPRKGGRRSRPREDRS
jgi:5-methyltetrahydrofolate--homocysteine methyltransferase